MNITFIVTKLDINSGGEKTDILLTAQALQERGHRVRIVTTFSELNVLPKTLAFDIIEEQAPSKKLLALQFFAVNIFKKNAPHTDVFYLIGSTFLFGAGWYRLNKNSRPIVAFLNSYLDFVEVHFKRAPLWPAKYLSASQGMWRYSKYRGRIFLERSLGVYLINKFDAVTIMSPTIADLHRRSGLNSKKITVSYCLHDIQGLQAKPLKPDPFNQFPQNTFHIVTVGRLVIEKGFDILVEAFARCRLPKTMLHVIGAGPLKSELVQRVETLDLSQVIKFYPWQIPEDLIAFYQHAQLFVHPARWPEAMVRTTVEAMALGVPLVVPDTSAETWVAEVAKTFKNGNIADLAAKLTAAYSDARWQATARHNGPLRARAFDYRQLIITLEQLLFRVSKQHSGHS